MEIGNIHSIETFGTVDGPGVRFVVFLQGCPMRCLYCHNPDTWEVGMGKPMSTDAVLEEYDKYKAYLRNGGLTCTGGEPLMQMDFVTELFKKAKNRGIHTCLDTCGITFRSDHEKTVQKFDELLEVTDLILLDLKHIDNAEHEILTSQKNTNILEFAKYLSERGKDIWVRHVVVPGYTDVPKYLEALGYFMGDLKNVKALDVLPYHTMGEVKYKSMGMEYPLKGVEALKSEDAVKAKTHILNGLKKRLLEKSKEV